MTQEALKLALEAMESFQNGTNGLYEGEFQEEITAIKEALAQPEHEKYCPICQGVGQVDTGIMESPVTICNACNGTGLKAQPEQDCTRSHPHEEMSKACELRTEIARLTNCLARANAQAEHFEREWYLRGDEIERLKAQPEQEPVAKVVCNSAGQISMQTLDGNSFDISKYVGSMFYTTPPQRTWVGLTKEEVLEFTRDSWGVGVIASEFIRAIEAKLKDKNDVAQKTNS